ncbi:MAG TPA: hypothetical protein VFW48_07875 [Solirubrobacterales bacterium]|nr:hypothetical protein [Solirubrobacterales bacterium]
MAHYSSGHRQLRLPQHRPAKRLSARARTAFRREAGTSRPGDGADRQHRRRRRRSAEQTGAADALPTGRERVAAGLDFIWSNYASPLYQAALDLWTDARTDEELRAALVGVERELDRQTLELARRLFPDQAGRADFERLVEMAAATARGLALLDTLHPGDDRNSKQWEFCRARLVQLFEQGTNG